MKYCVSVTPRLTIFEIGKMGSHFFSFKYLWEKNLLKCKKRTCKNIKSIFLIEIPDKNIWIGVKFLVSGQQQIEI